MGGGRYQSLRFCLGTNLDVREALSITELLSLHSFNSPFPSGNLRKANRAQLDFPFYLQMVTGGLTSYLSGESLASVSTGVFKRKNLGSKQAFQRARKGFLSVPRCLLSFWMGRGAMRRRCPSSLWWGVFFMYFRKLVSVICMSFEVKNHSRSKTCERMSQV